MADLETIGTYDPEEERRRLLAAAGASDTGMQPVAPRPLGAPDASGARRAIPVGYYGGANSTMEPIARSAVSAPEAPEIASPGGDNSGLQPLGATPGLKRLNFAERQALPTVSPGAPAGSAASHEARLERLQDQDANPWGSPENHPGLGGKVAHVLSKIGNIAGTVVAPSTMELIPGTDLNRKFEERNEERAAGEAQTRETAGKREEESARHNAAAENLESRRLDIEEDKPDKPLSVDQAAVDSKMKETNPATGKPYTAYEARVELSNDIAAGKAKPAGPPKTVTMLDKEGGKPYTYEYDANGNYTGDAGYGKWKKVGPAQPNAVSLGLIGTINPLINPVTGEIVGTMNSKTGQMSSLTPAQQEVAGQGGTTTGGARVATQGRNQFNTQYIKPSTDIEQNYQKFQEAYRDYLAGSATGAASMVALAQHLGSTFGSIKGTTQGEHMIREHKDAIGLWDRIGRMADNAVSGQQLSPDQWKEFGQLISKTREIQWQTAAGEAARRKQPVDFVPADVKVNMKDSKGNVRPVPGDRVQEYLDKGAKMAGID